MFGFIVGLLLGVAAKTVYDLFKEDQLPVDVGLNTGRIETLLDETRQTVRDLREEVRQAMAGEGTMQEKVGRVASAATEAVKGSKAGDTTAETEERLTVAGSGAEEADAGTGRSSRGSAAGSGGSSSGSSSGSGASSS